MRIELNSGGLGGVASISSMQSDISVLIGKSESLLSAFRAIKSYTCNMNGGVGNLQNALAQVETRTHAEEQKLTNLGETNTKINSFVELTQSVDLSVGKLVTKNKREFYETNPWAKPPQTDSAEKNFGEKAWDWLCGIGENIKETAKKAWDGIKSFCSTVKEKISEIGKMIHDLVFPKRSLYDSKKGCYGGNQMVFQSASAAERKKYREIFEKNNPGVNYTDKQFKNYMKKLTSEGCGYVALVNTIFEQYAGKEEEFEATFGYPMYKSNGKLNYEMLTVDLYSRMDNYDENGNYDINMDYDPGKDGDYHNYYYRDDNTGWGTTQYQREYYLEQFMSEHGVNVNVETDVTVTPENYNQIVASGKQVVVAFREGNLYNMDGSVAQPIDGGHAMTVTGTTSDGKLIVSSWGNQYYIDPSENGKSQQVGSGSNQHTITQSMTFSTVEYD